MPEEIRLLLKGISDEKNLGLLIALLKHGKMSFNEIKEKFQFSPSSLTIRLNELQDGNLVKNFYEKSGNKGFSYYDVTDIPELVFDSLFDIMYPSERKTESVSGSDKTEIKLARDWEEITKQDHQEKERTKEKFESILVGTLRQKIRPHMSYENMDQQPISTT
ncbi:MAG: winged helix-turn-helix transcriptional regulator [Thaumarchaeota archaeon]|nr:winged helix-turn-helix transcriptional regulator [Nitrososphaerota archaeon]